jgi:bacterioferritin (cytochrome b1)
MTAVNQYWLHHRLLDDWGFTRLAKKQREESIEEMQHADSRLIAYSCSKVFRTCRNSIL